MSLSILTLPGTKSYISGYYGLEECVVRGLVRISVQTGTSQIINSLQISLTGETRASFWESAIEFSKHTRKTIMVDESQTLLLRVNLKFNTGFYDIPFEIPFPLHETISHGFGACPQLLPGTLNLEGSTDFLKYCGNVQYKLTARMKLPSAVKFVDKSVDTSVCVPFQVYDPRLMVNLMHPSPRQWKSHVEAIPIQYDIEIDSNTIGRGDDFLFKYRILVSSIFASVGIRVQRVSLSLKEHHFVGDARCCALDDDDNNWFHGQPYRAMGTVEFPIHTQSEHGISNCASTMDKYPRQLYEKYDAADKKIPMNDGIFIERSIKLRLPETVNFDVPRPLPPKNDNICPGTTRGAFIMIRHTFVVTIGIWGGSDIKLEAICYVSQTNKKECLCILQDEPEILPNLDYERNIGLEDWVPAYSNVYNTEDCAHESALKSHLMKVEEAKLSVPANPKLYNLNQSVPPAYEESLIDRSTHETYVVTTEQDLISLTNPRFATKLVDAKSVEQQLHDAIEDSVIY